MTTVNISDERLREIAERQRHARNVRAMHVMGNAAQRSPSWAGSLPALPPGGEVLTAEYVREQDKIS